MESVQIEKSNEKRNKNIWRGEEVVEVRCGSFASSDALDDDM